MGRARMGLGWRRLVLSRVADPAERSASTSPRTFAAFERSSNRPAFRRKVGPLEGGEPLRRVPRGFAARSSGRFVPPVPHVRRGQEFPASFATNPRFCGGLVRSSGTSTPLIRFLNEPLTS